MAVGSVSAGGQTPPTSSLGMDTLSYALQDAESQTIKGLDEEGGDTSNEDMQRILGNSGDGVGGPPVDNATYQRMMAQGAQVG